MEFLRTDGSRIVDSRGKEVRLRGFSFAGWLNIENFMLGIPGHESGFRGAVAQAIGKKKAEFLFNRFLENFIAEKDFEFVSGLGCNLVRLPFNYRHFESDERPFEYLPEGFAWLDKAIAWGRKYGVYLILDLHAAQGAQNKHFFADNISGIPLLWEQRAYQDRAVALWREIARKYCDEPVLAGYDLLNEPTPGDVSQLNNFYRHATAAVRSVDQNHILFLEGESYSTKFDGLDCPYDSNVAYTMHFYSPCGMDSMEYPGVCNRDGQYYGYEQLKDGYLDRVTFMRRHNVPNWFGETSVTFPPEVSMESRLRFLRDILSIAEEQGDSWSFGIYKDLGRTGIVNVRPDSEWRTRIEPVYSAVMEFNCNPFSNVAPRGRFEELCDQLGACALEGIARVDASVTLEGMAESIRFALCECVLAKMLQLPFARQFAGMAEQDIDRMMRSFSFDNCVVREEWADVIRKTIKASGTNTNH